MLLNHRIIYSDNGTLTDLTHELNNYRSSTQSFTWVAAEDYLYVSSILPFNHQYFLMETANTDASSFSVDLWDGSDWVAAVDVLDDTKSGGAALGKSGHLSFALDVGESWQREDTEDMTGSGISSLRIFNHYWARLSLSADSSFEVKFIGQKFSDDEDLGTYYPDLNTQDARDQFNNGVAGKTTWDEQHIAAAEMIGRHLENQYEMISPSQIIRWTRLNEASVHKVAEIIYNSHGNDGRQNRDDAKAAYDLAIQFINTQFDTNRDTRLNNREGVPNLQVRRR